MIGSPSMLDGFRAAGARTTATDPWGASYLAELLDAIGAADVVLPDMLVSRDALAAIDVSGRPVGAIVHTMWGFVPSFDGTGRMMGPGFLDQLQRVLDALADAPVDVVATAGAHLDVSSLRVPANARVTGFVRHAALLPHADVFVGHGGHGGIMAALAFGVRVVSIPLDRDQPHNAARVEAAGAGRTVAKDAPAGVIRSTVLAVRGGERERSAAMRLANAIADHGNAAVDTVESLVR